MTNPLLQKIIELEKEFDEKFPRPQKEATHYQGVKGKEDCNCFSCSATFDEVKSFHRSSLISLLEKECEYLESKKMQEPPHAGYTRVEAADYSYSKGFNSALSQQISHLQEAIRGLQDNK